MIERPFWTERLAAGWKQAPIVWLTGPRRVGKTVLAQSLPDTERGREAADAIECEWKPESFETRGLAAFRAQYPKGKNYVVSQLPGPAYERVQNGLKISIV